MAQATWLLLLATIATPPAAAQTVESEEADIAIIWNRDGAEALRSVLDPHKEKGELPLNRMQRRLRGAAALALILIGSDDPDTYALLAHSLDVIARTPGGGDTHLNTVISGLGLLGSPFPLAQHALSRALMGRGDEMPALRKVAARSLGLIGAAHPVTALARCLMGEPGADPPAPPEGDPELRLECAAALGRIKPVSPLSAPSTRGPATRTTRSGGKPWRRCRAGRRTPPPASTRTSTGRTTFRRASEGERSWSCLPE